MVLRVEISKSAMLECGNIKEAVALEIKLSQDKFSILSVAGEVASLCYLVTYRIKESLDER